MFRDGRVSQTREELDDIAYSLDTGDWGTEGGAVPEVEICSVGWC